MISWKNLSKKEKAIVKEAVRLIASKKRPDKFLLKKDWTGPYYGQYKRAFVKGSIVVKKGPKTQLLKEEALWNKIKKTKYKKYIAKFIGIYKNWMVQEYIDGPQSWCCSKSCSKIAQEMKIPDWEQNHRHIKKRPVFFDTYMP